VAEPALIRGRNQIAGQSKQHKFLTKPNGCGDHFGSSFPGLRMSSLICEKTCLNCYQVFFPKWYTHCQAIIYTIYHSPSISIPSQVITYLSLSINIYPYLSISIHIYPYLSIYSWFTYQKWWTFPCFFLCWPEVFIPWIHADPSGAGFLMMTSADNKSSGGLKR
jgi:hypothetical protein